MSDPRNLGLFPCVTNGPNDPGTMCTNRSPTPGLHCAAESGYGDLESALHLLESEGINFGYRFIKDQVVRTEYISRTKSMAEAIRNEVRRGHLTAQEGAKDANQLRNALMETARINSSDIGLAKAQAEKKVGKTLVELEEYYAMDKFGKAFGTLSEEERNLVWGEIVSASGRPQIKFSAKSIRLGKIGKGFLFLSLAFAVYDITTAEDKPRQIAKEGVTSGASVLGGMAGGAVAGLACGPGAPVCVAVGVFVGGAMAALGADFAFDRLW